MKIILTILGGLAAVVILIVLLAVISPMTASGLLWPVVERVVLREPFVGITSDGQVREGLFEISATGVSTAPVIDAARTFLDTLTEDQRSEALFDVDDLEWRRWANVHLSARQGVGFLEMSDAQKESAFALIRSGLSARGYQTARDIMRLEGHLADLMDNYDEYGEERYWITVMGKPSETEPWGWQLDGHHLIVNFFVLGDQVVMTPTFMGSEPVRATSGRFAGVSILDEELGAGLDLINALTEEQRSIAIIDHDKTANNNYGELFSDNDIVPHEGLVLSDLDERQEKLALELIGLYVGNMRPGHAELKMTEVIRHWSETRLAWVGGTGPEAVFYYRIHSPVILIEYDHQTPVALGGPDMPTREHVHTVVRTPNGNDYGKDLLRQHLLTIPH